MKQKEPFWGPNAKEFGKQLLTLAILIVIFNLFFADLMRSGVETLFDIIWPVD